MLPNFPTSLVKTIMQYSRSNTKFQPLNGVLNMSKKHVRRMLTLMAVKHATFKINPAGLRVCTKQPFLAATPDGVVSCSYCSKGLLEIKCPFEYWNSPPASIEDESFYLHNVGSEVTLDKKHDYYYQVQGQMAIWKKPYCDFICWTTKGLIITWIQADGKFFEELHPVFEKTHPARTVDMKP